MLLKSLGPEQAVLDKDDKLEIYEQTLASNWEAIVIADLGGVVTFANPAAYKLYGYDVESSELTGMNVDTFNAQEGHDTEVIVNAIKATGGWSGEIIQRRKDNEHFTALLTVTLVFGKSGEPLGLSSNSKDLTDNIDTAKKIQDSDREKEVLLAEVHHRVKNNLQLISSILNLQSSFIEDESVIGTINSIQNRIQAMSLIHEKLYKQDVTSINLRDYADGLFKNIVEVSSINDNISCELNIDNIMLRIEKILPLGLLLNELITNSFKHAFEGKESGHISIDVVESNDEISLKYSDDGAGFDEGAESYQESFGTLLISTFSEQLDGELAYRSDLENGTVYELVFSR
jgi:PAS domain S-box-containing protein